MTSKTYLSFKADFTQAGAAPMTPTDKDREAAAPIMLHLYAAYDTEVARKKFRAEILSGAQDQHFVVQAFMRHRVQAFMRHRLAAEERGAKMALEAAVAAVDEGIDCDGIIASDIARLDPAAIVGGQSDEH